jgi:hypothetical protein
MHLAEAPVKIELHGSSTGGSGPDLTGYPHLTYAPGQWGEGVRVASNGIPIAQIAEECGDHLGFNILTAAGAYGISIDELFEALKYGRAQRLF